MSVLLFTVTSHGLFLYLIWFILIPKYMIWFAIVLLFSHVFFTFLLYNLLKGASSKQQSLQLGVCRIVQSFTILTCCPTPTQCPCHCHHNHIEMAGRVSGRIKKVCQFNKWKLVDCCCVIGGSEVMWSCCYGIIVSNVAEESEGDANKISSEHPTWKCIKNTLEVKNIGIRYKK